MPIHAFVGRELLSNAGKHARATEIRLGVTETPRGVTLEVADDGRGIAEGRIRQALLEGHIGLAAVNERVAALSGSLSIDSSPGNGTSVRVTLPGTVENPRVADGRPGVDVSDRVTRVDAFRVSTGQA